MCIDVPKILFDVRFSPVRALLTGRFLVRVQTGERQVRGLLISCGGPFGPLTWVHGRTPAS